MFKTAYSEWKYQGHSERVILMLIEDLECPACTPELHSIHIDANMKLIVWRQHYEGHRVSYYVGTFLHNSVDVMEHLRTVDVAKGQAQVCMLPPPHRQSTGHF